MATELDRRAHLPETLATPTAGFWRTLTRLRRTRIFHPRGTAYEAVVDVPGGAGTGVALFDEEATHAATVRFSRGVGLPEPLPDIPGIALRLRDVHGRGRHQDLMMNASIDRPLLHHVMLPARTGVFSTILAYDVAGMVRLFGARQDDGEEGFTLTLAPLFGRFAPIATVRLGAALPPARAEALRFNPWHTGGGIRPAGPFQHVRAAAYRGSQSGR
jgi:hypothetical protein